MRALGALILREWRSAWTAGASYALRALYAGLVAAACIAWPLMLAGLDLRTEHAGQVTRWLLAWLFRFELVVLTFLGTVTYVRSLHREKERGTFDLLVLSPLGPGRLLLGKALGRLLSLLALLAAGFPGFLVLSSFGGMDPSEIASAHLILAGHLALVGGIATVIGARASSAASAILLVWTLVLVLVAASVLASFGYPNIVDAVSPLRYLNRQLASVRPNLGVSVATLAAGLGVLGACSLAAGRILTLQPAVRVRRAGLLGSLASLVALLFRPLRPWLARRHPLTQQACDLSRDPLFAVGWIAFVAVLGIAIATIQTRVRGVRAELHEAAAAIGGSAAMFALILHGSLSLTAERGRRVYESLLSVNVEPADIVRSKLAGHLMRAAILLLPPLAYWLLTALETVRREQTEMVWPAAGATVLGVVAAVVVTLAVSLRIRNAVLAATVSLLAACPVAGLVTVIGALGWVWLIVDAIVLTTILTALHDWTVRGFRRFALAG